MIGLLPYLEHAFLLANQSSSNRGCGKDDGSEKLIFWVSIILGVVSYVLIVAGLGIYLSKIYDPSLILCVVGLITLSTMLLIIGCAQFYKNRRIRKAERMFSNVTSGATGILNDLTENFGHEFKDNALLIALLAAGAGFVLSRKIF
jgi:hypothetical protein